MNVEPCNVCGGTDVNLVDGFYYCAECGTQDVNVRETVIEERALADGTFTIRRHNKVTIAAEETQELSGEWHKWHAFNFMLVGLADQLIADGAKPTFKKKLLWLWTKYIKKYQNKEELGITKEVEEVQNTTEPHEDEDLDNTSKKGKKKRKTTLKMATDISKMKKQVLFSLIYAALNLDGSEIQYFDLLRFAREGRLDFHDYAKYLPKEVKFRLVPKPDTFVNSGISLNCTQICTMTLFKDLDIAPVMPDLKLIVDRFIKELCLPNDFKNLVLSLMNLIPCDVFLEVDKTDMKSFLRLPPYEYTVMAYILVAFKICFGLDDNYEVKLSDVVEKINDENCHLKSYKLGYFSESSDRLFCFRDWCSFIQLRKILLCKYILHMAEQFTSNVDDYVYIEQCNGRKKVREPLLSDEITMNLLEKIPQVSTVEVIPKSEFKATLTPMSTYTDIILQYIRDPDLRLIFSEDFTQYSLKYACERFNLSDGEDVKNIIIGVDNTKKVIKQEVFGRLKDTPQDTKMVYIRNCENKNWLKTKPPSAEHIKKVKKSGSDRESDHGYDSNAENTPEIEISSIEENSNKDSEENVEGKIEKETKLEIIEEEDSDKNIFDDDFENMDIIDTEKIENDEIKSEPDLDEYQDNYQHIDTFQDNPDDLESNADLDDSKRYFNPDTFDRRKTIKELILATCEKYKIRVPDEYNTKQPTKRKSKLVNDMAGESGVKRRKLDGQKRKIAKPGEAREQVHKLLADYYNNLQKDVMLQISEHVKKVVSDVNRTQDCTEENHGLDETDNSGANNVEVVDDATIGEHNLHANTNDDVEVDSPNIDESNLQIIENEEEEEEEEQQKGDPKFDEKEFDIRQLYVNVEDESDSDDTFGMGNDPTLISILDKKIAEAAKGETPKLEEKEIISDKEIYESDDELPLSVLKAQKTSLGKTDNEKLPNLIVNHKQLGEFKYWTRFYAGSKMRRSHNLHEPFNLDLQDSYPAGFVFVLKECANILDCSSFILYKSMVLLEQRIQSHNN